MKVIGVKAAEVNVEGVVREERDIAIVQRAAYGRFLEHSWDIPGTFLEHVWNIPRSSILAPPLRVRNVLPWKISGIFLEHFWEVSGTLLEHS